MAKSHASKVKLAPSTVVAQRVMAHHEQGGMSQGELRRNYLSGGGAPLGAPSEQMRIGKVPEGICPRGEWFGTQVSEPSRAAQLRPLVGKPSLPPVSPDDVMTHTERGCVYFEDAPDHSPNKGKLMQEGGLFRTRDGRVVRTTHMGDAPLPRPVTRRRSMPTTVIDDGSERAAELLRAKGWPINAKNLAHARDYLAAKDAGIIRF